MSREAMQMALEALESKYVVNCGAWRVQQDQAIAALRQALETEQEPVAWMHTTGTGHVYFRKKPQDKVFNPQPVYTVPPKKQWVGLTLNEAEDFYEKYTDRAELINAVDKFLEEKNRG